MTRLTHYLMALCLTLGFASLEAQTSQYPLLAFPEAEGFGRFTTGGRGGEVCYVTRLDDCTDANLVEGTLRWAIRHDNGNRPRTILFDTCGTIFLTSKLKFQYPDVTIAGQTAPGGGICIAGANIYVCKPNVILRYLRFRAGDLLKTNYAAIDVENTKNVIVDHCSFTWSMEECVTWYDTDSTTIQWSIIGEGFYSSYHKKGDRSYATQWGGEHSTMHHTLITNCYNRCPRFNGVRDEAGLADGHHNHDANVDSEFANNVVYNWGKQNSLYGGECDTTKNRLADGSMGGHNHVYMLNNYFVEGPTTRAAINGISKYRFVKPDTKNGYGAWLLVGNLFSVQSPLNEDNYSGWLQPQAPILSAMTDSSNLVLQSATDAYASVCQAAGCSLPRYDEEDTRLLAEAAGTQAPQFHGKAKPAYLGIIDSQDDITFTKRDWFYVGDSLVKCYPYIGYLPGDMRALDTDQDGMPDLYETQVGLDPNDATDGTLITESGYSNLELYLNGVASGTIDKSAYETLSVVIPEEPADPQPAAIDYITYPKAHKVLHDGRVYIQTDKQTFLLSGQELK